MRDYATRLFISLCFGLIPSVLLICIGLLIPSTKQAAVIYTLPKMTNAIENSKTLKHIPGKMVEYVDEWLNVQISDIKETKK